jgi:hypothetical protein
MNFPETSRHSIAVVMATYNGARYLEEQLDSLWRQTRQDFELVIRDDGSTDGTTEILQRAAALRPDRIRLVGDELGRLGPKSSFAVLLRQTQARWIAFCDQDDYWLSSKLARQVTKLEELEAVHGQEVPLLCCSDAAVTNSQLQVAAPSYFSKHNIRVADGRDLALPRLLFRNYAIGATTMINAALAARCRAMPEEAVMHDWWCALVACISGKSVVLPDALIQYRQHGGNAVGSLRRTMPRTSAQFLEYVHLAQSNTARCVRQAQALHRASTASPFPIAASANKILNNYASFPSQSRFERALTVLRTRSFKPGFALNGLHVYACVTAPL